MELVAGVFWIALGIFIIIKKGVADESRSSLLGAACAIWAFLSFFVCGKILEFTEGSVICFFFASLSCVFALVYVASNDKQGVMRLFLRLFGFIFTPIGFIVECLKFFTDHTFNPFSLAIYVFFACYDIYWFIKKKESESKEQDKFCEETKKEHGESNDRPAECDTCDHSERIWMNGRFVESAQEEEHGAMNEQIANNSDEYISDYTSCYSSYPFNGDSQDP